MARQGSVESRAFRQCYAGLTIGIQSGVERISDIAYSQGIIPRIVLQQVRDSNQSETKAYSLLKAIEDKISGDPTGFQRFVDILKEEACYGHLVRALEVKYGK